MGVFPVASSRALPLHYRQLMSDPTSLILDFCPTDFEVDMNGKRYAWQGIAKFSFIDENRLLSEIRKVEHTFTTKRSTGNSIMSDMLFVKVSYPLSPYIFSLISRFSNLPDKEKAEAKEKFDPMTSGGMNGYLCLCGGEPCSLISNLQLKKDIMDNQVICSIYKLPDAHKTQPPAGVIFPQKMVTSSNLKPPPVLWYEDNGRRQYDNGRQPYDDAGRKPYESGRRHNPTESISGKQVGDAAHRLVVNSLQISRDNHHSTSKAAPFPYNAGAVSTQYSNSRYDVDPRTTREEHQIGHSQYYGHRNDGPGYWHSYVVTLL
ncbi:5'-3' exoribonuclease 3-like [Zingiber officinale]|uniref:5'-3' exoribonuclease 3-like n=1 Tax=Zingiber officinale TaxID=94328 RepID=UPI001C4D74BF|nr:5'-3' exoribonuclease 3-like [Zingiber officinale]